MRVFDRFKKLRLGQKTMIILAILVVSIGGWIAYDNIRPRPLGDEMVYLGKESSGGGLFYKDYAPSVTYYYGTDLSPDNIPAYLHAELKNSIDNTGQYTDVSLTGQHGDFIVTYRNSTQFTTKKKYTVTVSDENYLIAEKYLK